MPQTKQNVEPALKLRGDLYTKDFLPINTRKYKIFRFLCRLFKIETQFVTALHVGEHGMIERYEIGHLLPKGEWVHVGTTLEYWVRLEHEDLELKYVDISVYKDGERKLYISGT